MLFNRYFSLGPDVSHGVSREGQSVPEEEGVWNSLAVSAGRRQILLVGSLGPGEVGGRPCTAPGNPAAHFPLSPSTAVNAHEQLVLPCVVLVAPRAWEERCLRMRSPLCFSRPRTACLSLWGPTPRDASPPALRPVFSVWMLMVIPQIHCLVGAAKRCGTLPFLLHLPLEIFWKEIFFLISYWALLRCSLYQKTE